MSRNAESAEVITRSQNAKRWILAPGWVISHLFVLSVVAIMVYLGFWQLQRLEDRQQQNNQTKAILDEPPQEIEALLASARASGELPPDHTAAVAVGKYLYEHSFLIANRTLDSEPGYWLVTPMELADGTVVVISRGWVPRLWAVSEASKVAEASQVAEVGETGSVTVIGRVFASIAGGRIGTSDAAILPELNRLDLERVKELTGLAVADLWLQLERQQPEVGGLPVPLPPVSLDDGPHLSYAFQWFFFSVGAVVVYGLILRKRNREPRPKDSRKISE